MPSTHNTHKPYKTISNDERYKDYASAAWSVTKNKKQLAVFERTTLGTDPGPAVRSFMAAHPGSVLNLSWIAYLTTPETLA
jgi:hypothetical protein